MALARVGALLVLQRTREVVEQRLHIVRQLVRVPDRQKRNLVHPLMVPDLAIRRPAVIPARFGSAGGSGPSMGRGRPSGRLLKQVEEYIVSGGRAGVGHEAGAKDPRI